HPARGSRASRAPSPRAEARLVSSRAMPDALFAPEDGCYRPSELARGPWSPEALHGGPVAALLAHLADGAEAPGPMHPTRLTIELLRPVPLAPLRPAVRIVRPGRKVQLVESSLFAGDVEVAR